VELQGCGIASGTNITIIKRMADPKTLIEKRKAWSESMKTTLLVKKLRDHVLDGPCMDQSQVAAARILLAKTIPDLKAVEHSGEVTGVVSNHFHF